jgi:hypothetical protein
MSRKIYASKQGSPKRIYSREAKMISFLPAKTHNIIEKEKEIIKIRFCARCDSYVPTKRDDKYCPICRCLTIVPKRGHR